MGVLWSPILIILGLLLKIGLPPVHIWFIKISFLLKKWIFLIFSTIHKLLPLLILGSLLTTINYLVWAVLLAAGTLIFQVFELFFVLLASSIIHSRWALLAIQFNIKLRLAYWILYSLVFIIFLTTVYFFILFKRGIEQSSSTIVVWLILSGLPPFIIFWLKVWIFLSLVQTRASLSLMLISISVLALTSYFRAFHTSLRLAYYSDHHKSLLLRVIFLSYI